MAELKPYQIELGQITIPEGISCYQVRVTPEGKVFYSDINHDGYKEYLEERKKIVAEREAKKKVKAAEKLKRAADREAKKLQRIADRKAKKLERIAKIEKEINALK